MITDRNSEKTKYFIIPIKNKLQDASTGLEATIILDVSSIIIIINTYQSLETLYIHANFVDVMTYHRYLLYPANKKRHTLFPAKDPTGSSAVNHSDMIPVN